MAVGIRLGLPICVRHQCCCGMQVDAYEVHSFVCKRAPGRTARHQALNELIARAFASNDIPVVKEPSGLARADGKKPDGLSLIPWQGGRPLCWDVTVVCPTASSYLQTANVSAGSVAEMAAIRKTSKYQELAAQYSFQPVALESLGSMDSDTRDFLVDLGRRITRDSGDDREISFFVSAYFCVLFRFNPVLLFDSFELGDRLEL